MRKLSIINKNYTKLLIATFITRFGDAVDSIAFSWLVYVLTGSKLLMGTIFAVSVIPNIIILPFAGVLADLFNKKVITVISDFARGFSVVGLATLYYFNILEVWHIFLFVILNSLFESFATPARGAMLPSLINEEEYVSGGSYLQSASTLGEIIGLSLAGVFIAVFNIWGTILIDAMTFFISGFIIIFIRYMDKRDEITSEKQTIKDCFKLIYEGIDYLRSRKMLLVLLLLGAFINFSLVPFNVLRPVYVVEVLNLGVEGLSYLGLALLFGMMVGGIIVGKFGKGINPIRAIGFGLAMVAFNYALLGAIEFFHFSTVFSLIYVIVVSFFFGFFLPVVQAPIRAVIMKTTASEMIGRLSSIMGLISLCAIPLGGTLVGIIGDNVSVSVLFISMGVVGVLISSAFGIKYRNKEFA